MNVEGAEVERRLGPHDHAALPRRLVSLGTDRRRRVGVPDGRAVGARCRCTSAVLGVARRGAGCCAATRALPAGRGATRTAAVDAGARVAGAAHAGDRRDGARLRRGRGHRQRLAVARAHRRVRRRALGRRRRLRAVRVRDDRRPARRTGRARPVRPGAGAVGDVGRGRGRDRCWSSSAGTPCWSALGIVLWGLGASLGFPVGMSAAADDPARSPPGSPWSRPSATPRSWPARRCSAGSATRSAPWTRCSWSRCSWSRPRSACSRPARPAPPLA